jgi:outer membrane biosynthesis protein TonB
MCHAARFFCNQGTDIDESLDRASICLGLLSFAEALDAPDPPGASLKAKETVAALVRPPSFPTCAAALLRKNTELAAQAKDVSVLHDDGKAKVGAKRKRGHDGDQPKTKVKAEPKDKAKPKAKGKAKAGVKRGKAAVSSDSVDIE